MPPSIHTLRSVASNQGSKRTSCVGIGWGVICNLMPGEPGVMVGNNYFLCRTKLEPVIPVIRFYWHLIWKHKPLVRFSIFVFCHQCMIDHRRFIWVFQTNMYLSLQRNVVNLFTDQVCGDSYFGALIPIVNISICLLHSNNSSFWEYIFQLYLSFGLYGHVRWSKCSYIFLT